MLKMREEIILKGKLFITPNKLYEPIIYIQYQLHIWVDWSAIHLSAADFYCKVK